jgi:hypothetical protein
MRPLATLALAALLSVGTALAEEIANPETPSGGVVTHSLEELWRRGGDDDDLMFGVVAEIVPGEAGSVYVLDSQLSEVQVLDADGELLRTIGREGDGPGEFSNGSDMFWLPDGELGVIQGWPGKIVLLGSDGTPGRPFRMPFREGGGLQVASRGAGADGRIVLSGSAWVSEGEQQYQLAYLKAYDGDGNELAHFTDYKRETAFGNFEFREETWNDFQRRWAAAADGRVAASLDYGDYRIHVWNADGSLDRVITRPDHRPVRRTDHERGVAQAMYDRFTSWNRGSTFAISDEYQAVAQLMFAADGSLWVQSGADRWRSADGVATAFDVYDRDGVYARRVVLAGDVDAAVDGIFPVGDRVYVVTDLLNALMASFGVDADDGLGAEPEPISVVAYRMVGADGTP